MSYLLSSAPWANSISLARSFRLHSSALGGDPKYFLAQKGIFRKKKNTFAVKRFRLLSQEPTEAQLFTRQVFPYSGPLWIRIRILNTDSADLYPHR